MPGGQMLGALARLGINTNWVLTGDGQMLLSDAPQTGRTGPFTGSARTLNLPETPKMPRLEDRPRAVRLPDLKKRAPAGEDAGKEGAPARSDGETASADYAGYVAVALYNGIHAAAGHGAVAGTETPDDALMFKEDWIRFELGAKPADLCLIRVSGDSMEPTLRAGDVILVDRRAQQPDREGIYILRMDDMLLVKRLQALPGGVLQVSSDNAAFATWTLKVADLEANAVHIIGRVVWAGRRF